MSIYDVFDEMGGCLVATVLLVIILAILSLFVLSVFPVISSIYVASIGWKRAGWKSKAISILLPIILLTIMVANIRELPPPSTLPGVFVLLSPFISLGLIGYSWHRSQARLV